MRILFAGDEQPYSENALKKLIGLAMNTWADVTLLSVLPAPAELEGGHAPPSDHSLGAAMSRYREEFLKAWGGEESPYAPTRFGYEWVPVKGGLWEELRVSRGSRKDLKVRVRSGAAANEILAEAGEEGSDLIVLGCTGGDRCIWTGASGVPQKVANDAGCSVLLVKEDQAVKRIFACVDQIPASQESLEMINQMVTIHKAELELIGLTRDKGPNTEVYTRLIEVGDYFSDRRMEIKTRLMDMADFDRFVKEEAKEDLIAFRMEKKSLLNLFFPRDWVGRFVSTCRSSVLVLR